MSYPAPVACTLCDHATIGTHPGGVCRVCDSHRTPSLVWDTITLHADCPACERCADSALSYARAMGSTRSTYGDGEHRALAMRKAVTA